MRIPTNRVTRSTRAGEEDEMSAAREDVADLGAADAGARRIDCSARCRCSGVEMDDTLKEAAAPPCMLATGPESTVSLRHGHGGAEPRKGQREEGGTDGRHGGELRPDTL